MHVMQQTQATRAGPLPQAAFHHQTILRTCKISMRVPHMPHHTCLTSDSVFIKNSSSSALAGVLQPLVYSEVRHHATDLQVVEAM